MNNYWRYRMTFDEYVKLAMRTNGTTTFKECIDNAVLGLCGESGEVADMVKKWKFHGHPLDAMKLRKEIGDILWYCAQACHAFGWDLEGVAEDNIIKLRNRYPEGFSSQASLNRPEYRDYTPGEALDGDSGL